MRAACFSPSPSPRTKAGHRIGPNQWEIELPFDVVTAKTIAEHFQDGIDLFNAGRFFECHEAWEQAWLRSAGADKVFY